MEHTQEEVDELVALTPEQKKAWAQLVRAVNKCRKENIFFYQVLEALGGLNGNNIKAIACDPDFTGVHDKKWERDEYSLQRLGFPSIETVDGFADDAHYVILKGGK